MENLNCRSCGGMLEKNGSIYICQSCGEAFNQAEIDGTYQDQNEDKIETVDRNSSKELNNLYILAQRAKESSNRENAAKYYEMILLHDPNSWEANFYSTYFSSMSTKLIDADRATYKLSRCLDDVFMLLKKTVSDGNQIKKYIEQINTDVLVFASMVNGTAEDHYREYSNTSGASSEYLDRVDAVFTLLCELGDQIEKHFPNEISTAVDIWKQAIDTRKKAVYNFWTSSMQSKALAVCEKIKKEIPEYEGVSFTNRSGGCYIATCVYGSYDCPEVWTLRRFRDNKLAGNCFGRAFIHTYYAVSPTLVKWFGNTNWFKAFWKKRLDHMVLKLKSQGFDDSHYND